MSSVIYFDFVFLGFFCFCFAIQTRCYPALRTISELFHSRKTWFSDFETLFKNEKNIKKQNEIVLETVLWPKFYQYCQKHRGTASGLFRILSANESHNVIELGELADNVDLKEEINVLNQIGIHFELRYQKLNVLDMIKWNNDHFIPFVYWDVNIPLSLEISNVS